MVGLPFRLVFGDWQSLIYIVRFTEYLALSSLALSVSRNFLLVNIFLSLVAAVLLNLVGSDYSLFKYMQWEPSMIAAMFAVSLFYRENISRKFKAGSLLLAGLHVYISGQRSPLLPLLVPIFLSAKRHILKAGFMIMVMLLALVFTDNQLINLQDQHQ